jgi:hypothetical protein
MGPALSRRGAPLAAAPLQARAADLEQQDPLPLVLSGVAWRELRQLALCHALLCRGPQLVQVLQQGEARLLERLRATCAALHDPEGQHPQQQHAALLASRDPGRPSHRLLLAAEAWSLRLALAQQLAQQSGLLPQLLRGTGLEHQPTGPAAAGGSSTPAAAVAAGDGEEGLLQQQQQEGPEVDPLEAMQQQLSRGKRRRRKEERRKRRRKSGGKGKRSSKKRRWAPGLWRCCEAAAGQTACECGCRAAADCLERRPAAGGAAATTVAATAPAVEAALGQRRRTPPMMAVARTKAGCCPWPVQRAAGAARAAPPWPPPSGAAWSGQAGRRSPCRRCPSWWTCWCTGRCSGGRPPLPRRQ